MKVSDMLPVMDRNDNVGALFLADTITASYTQHLGIK